MSRAIPADDHSPPHVVHMTEATGGGVRRHLRLIVPGLVRRGAKVDLILALNRAESDFSVDLAEYRSLGCRVDTVSIPSLFCVAAYPAAVRHTRNLLRTRRPQLVHLHAAKAGLVGRLAARDAGVATFYSPHAFGFEGGGSVVVRRAVLWLERRLSSGTDGFVFVSEAEHRLALDRLGLDPDKTRVIENGLPRDFTDRLRERAQIRREWRIPEETLLIGVPGRLAHQKGQDWLIAALARVNFGLADVRILFCGDGPSRGRLRRLARKTGISARCLWPGCLPALSECCKAFDLVVLPSRYEGLSYALLEAAAADIPLIVSDIPANRLRPLPDGDLAAVPPGDCVGLARTIEEFLGARQDWAARARRNGEIVRREFTLERQIDGLFDAYREHGSATT